MRMTRTILMKKLQFLCDKLGKQIGYEKGQWFLDHNATYGGYIVVEMMERKGEHHPLLRKRLPAAQMSDCLDIALYTLNYREQND
jgi:hypothetical protein